MRVAELSADLRYRALYQPEVLAGDHDALIEAGWFDGDQPIGDRWVARQAVYFDPSRHNGCEFESAADEVPEAERPLGDFPYFWGINFGVLTQRSYKTLHDLLEPCVEFLPLSSPDGEFTALKVRRFADALDEENSVIDWFGQFKREAGKPRVARQIKKYSFREERLEQEVIFRLPQMPFSQRVFVTEPFIQAVENHGLTGFQFTQVWPPVDQRQRFLEKRRRKRGSQR